MEKNVTHNVRITVGEYEAIARIATSEERSISNLLSVWVKRALRDYGKTPLSMDDDAVVMHHEVPR